MFVCTRLLYVFVFTHMYMHYQIVCLQFAWVHVLIYVCLCMFTFACQLLCPCLCLCICASKLPNDACTICMCVSAFFFPYWEWHVQNRANRNYKMQDLFSIYFAICTKITPHKLSQGRAAPSAVVIIKSQRSLHPVRLTALLFIISIHTCPNP